MERERRVESPWRADLVVPEPQFEDERTVQTARPVVPLAVVARSQKKRGLILFGALALAAMLGAGVALGIARLHQPAALTRAEPEKTETDNNSEAVVQMPQSDVNEGQAANPSNADKEATGLVEETEKVQKPTRRAIRNSIPKVTIAVTPNDDNPQPRLVDEWQERRQRRVTRPPRQNNNHKSDLFRIREIFEGSRRRPE